MQGVLWLVWGNRLV